MASAGGTEGPSAGGATPAEAHTTTPAVAPTGLTPAQGDAERLRVDTPLLNPGLPPLPANHNLDAQPGVGGRRQYLIESTMVLHTVYSIYQ